MTGGPFAHVGKKAQRKKKERKKRRRRKRKRNKEMKKANAHRFLTLMHQMTG